MLSVTVGLILILNQVIASSPCKSDYLTASMCQTSEARGSGVTLDVSAAAATNHSSCMCSVTSNVTGFIVEFEDNPNTTDCGVQLDILFEDKSMQLKCGIPASGQSTSGRTAQIKYTRDADVETIDSNYCLSFHASRLDVDFTLSCVVQEQTTALTIAQTSSVVPHTSPGSVQTLLAQTSSVVPHTSPGSVQTLFNNTTPAPSLSSSAGQTFVSTKEVQTSISLPTDGTSTVFESSNFTVTSTLPNESPTGSSIIYPVSTDSVLTNETTSFVSTSVTAGSTSFVDTTSLSPPASTGRSFVTTDTAGNNTKTTTTRQVNVTTTVDTPKLNITQSTDHTTDTLTGQGYYNVTTLANETSTVLTSTVSVSTKNKPTVNVTEITTVKNNVTSNTSSQSTTSLTTSHGVLNETSTGFGNTSSLNTTVTKPFYTNATTQPENYNTTMPYSSNITSDYSITTREYTVTTDMYENYTSPKNTTISTTYDTTTLFYINTTENITQTTTIADNTTSSNTTQTNNRTNFTSTETYNNITSVNNTTDSENTTTISQVTEVTNFTTTERYNGTLDNSTTDTNASTIAKLDTTTRGFWEPPIQNYDVPSRSNNIVLILVPVAGILLLVFIAVVVYIMCKRSKKASRRTRVPNAKNKADRNGNVERRGNMMEPNMKSDISEKPQKPVDMFVTQSNGKYPAKYKTETEKSDKDKTDLLDRKHGDTLFKEQLKNTLDSNTLTSTGKPMVYEPSEREKDLLDHLELSSIVIENDPNDPNRYFKKSDPGDWYRVIMKGKKPRDSQESRHKTDGKSKKKSKSSGSENEASDTKHRRKKHRERKHKQHRELDLSGSAKRKAKSGHSSSDSFDKTLSDNDNEIRKSKTASQTRFIVSEPSHQLMSTSTNSNQHPQPRQVVSKPANEQETKPEHVKTRVVVSKPSGVNMPTQIRNNSSDDVVMMAKSKESGQLGEDKHLRNESLTSSSYNGSESSTVPDRNTPLRSSQTRNSLFGSKKIIQNNKEIETDNKPAVKRPDIVPPLNLTETGDRVGRLDDGFEEFVLSEC